MQERMTNKAHTNCKLSPTRYNPKKKNKHNHDLGIDTSTVEKEYNHPINNGFNIGPLSKTSQKIFGLPAIKNSNTLSRNSQIGALNSIKSSKSSRGKFDEYLEGSDKNYQHFKSPDKNKSRFKHQKLTSSQRTLVKTNNGGRNSCINVIKR